MIKLPEPTAFSIFDYEGSEALYLMENNEELYKRYQQQDAKALDNLYTEDQLKQAIRDILENAATEFEHMGGFKDGYSCASRLRKLKEQL